MTRYRAEFDLTFEAFSFREEGGGDETVDMGLTTHGQMNVWSRLSREKLEFIRDRIDDYLKDTARPRRFTYPLPCGHKYVSPWRFSLTNRGWCRPHGFQYPERGRFLPTWYTWKLMRKARDGSEQHSSQR